MAVPSWRIVNGDEASGHGRIVPLETAPTSTAAPSISSPRLPPFTYLPPELRLRIYNCAIEPRLLLLNDLVDVECAHPLPAVTQVNSEARIEARGGYERVGKGSYFNFARDILVCDYRIADRTTFDSVAEDIASRAERVVFWDCVPDEQRIALPKHYFDYVSQWCDQDVDGRVTLDRFWFPNVKEFWSVKVGDVARSWHVNFDKSAPCSERIQQAAREYRYWVDANVVEVATLDLSQDAMSRLVLREGRCDNDNCQRYNVGRTHILSKVNFMDGDYCPPDDGREWYHVRLSEETRCEVDGCRAAAARLRWSLVERSFTFFLRWDWPMDMAGVARKRNRLEYTGHSHGLYSSH
ncbi:uncharacterized protein F5Z01DRAFT_122709 [Emericellopsis atlantica]|uniref:2EXR domain-containing protein n=1 Tax=Emericellopsis atlantica TaxID=2614577 RepID=A0A9P7ZM68_9HYPO|nr:uncharacterized protein F5Z01DRAFT_122709 [Emericellopsis atlantica]KAG9254241.1 hypothetical protein F5Z01DRAFT_122709 [Emericellopsis atlantica]